MKIKYKNFQVWACKNVTVKHIEFVYEYEVVKTFNLRKTMEIFLLSKNLPSCNHKLFK